MSEMVDRILDVMQSRGLMADEADARAVLAAMRKPTQAMLKAGVSEYEQEQGGMFQERIEVVVRDHLFPAMIDAALESATDDVSLGVSTHHHSVSRESPVLIRPLATEGCELALLLPPGCNLSSESLGECGADSWALVRRVAELVVASARS